MILPTGGLAAFVGPDVVDGSGWGDRTLLTTPDMTGDGRVDLLTFDAAGSLEIRPGTAEGGFADVSRRVRALRQHALVTAVGDLDGDGRADLVARGGGVLVSFLGNAKGGFRGVASRTSVRVYRQLVTAGDVTGDGHPDLWGRDRRNRWFLHPGDGDGGFAARSRVSGEWPGLTWVTGGVDYTADTLPDVVARRADGGLVILPSRGDGTLGRPLGPVLRRPGLGTISGAGQLTGDPAPDLVAVDEAGALVVLRNRGTFDVGRPIDTGQSFARGNRVLNAGDMDGDGHGDVVLRRRAGSLWLYRGDGAGRLAAPVMIGGKRTFRPVSELRVVPDVTGDQRSDVVGRTGEGQTMVWPGSGAARLGEGYEVVVTGVRGTPRGVAGYDWVVEVSDLRRRGAGDLVARDGQGDLYRLDGRKRGYRAPRYLGPAGGYDLAG
jgi:hypothetical protein